MTIPIARSHYPVPDDDHICQLIDPWMNRRMIDWQESAAQGLSYFLQIPMGQAREAVRRMFAVIEDVDYLVLIDCHAVTDEQERFTYPHRDPDDADPDDADAE